MTFHERVESAVRAAAVSQHIEVETRGGDHVILWGVLDSQDDVAKIERAVWSVEGVCNVDSNLTVRTRLDREPQRP